MVELITTAAYSTVPTERTPEPGVYDAITTVGISVAYVVDAEFEGFTAGVAVFIPAPWSIDDGFVWAGAVLADFVLSLMD